MKQLPEISYKLNPKTRFLSALDREFFARNLKPADVLRKTYSPEIVEAIMVAKMESMATNNNVAQWLGINETTFVCRMKIGRRV